MSKSAVKTLRMFMSFASGLRGRHVAISARHYLKPGRSHDRCTDSLITLYRKVIAQ
ncbi:MAG: hypothetical protein IJS28_10465 [Synergistaceae bacterium]|nr:hypothetical protein [Synergistaceae bacterium]